MPLAQLRRNFIHDVGLVGGKRLLIDWDRKERISELLGFTSLESVYA